MRTMLSKNEKVRAGIYITMCCTLSMLFLQFLVLAVAGIRHGTRWLSAMMQGRHSCNLVVFCKSSEKVEAWKQQQPKKRGSLMMSKIHPNISISHLLPENVIWKLIKEIGMPESEFKSGLASGKLYHLATWMINTEQKNTDQPHPWYRGHAYVSAHVKYMLHAI